MAYYWRKASVGNDKVEKRCGTCDYWQGKKELRSDGFYYLPDGKAYKCTDGTHPNMIYHGDNFGCDKWKLWDGKGSGPAPQEPDQGLLLFKEAVPLLQAGNYDKAILKLTQSINAGGINKANAYLLRAMCYGNKDNYDQAIDDYTDAISTGLSGNDLATAYCCRGNCYNYKGDRDQAIADYKKAADLGDTTALKNLADIQNTPNSGGSSSSEDMVALLSEGFQAYNAGNYAKAVELFRKAAEQGNMNAQYNLGNCYENGNGVPQDYKKAAEWYTKAADQGDMDAQLYLGDCYFDGNGVPQDYKKGAEWYRKSAEQGNTYAQYNLGNCLIDGNGVQQNQAEGVKWLIKASEQGNDLAQNNLGYAYQHGEGVKQDLKKAKEWYEKAAAQGNKRAKEHLAELN
jgi:TPR repeat protein